MVRQAELRYGMVRRDTVRSGKVRSLSHLMRGFGGVWYGRVRCGEVLYGKAR